MTAHIDEIAATWVARRDQGLSADEETELQQWRESDPRHAAALRRFEQTWGTLARPRQTGAVEELSASIAGAARSRRRRRTSALAVMALLIFSGSTWYRVAEAPTEARIAGAAPARIEKLPDGSTLEIRAGAHAVAEFDEKVRRVRLTRGMGYFQVAKDPARPFVVVANGVEVRAVGTEFAVEIDAALIEVIVTEGRVSVATPAPVPNPPALVASGQRIVVNSDRGVAAGVADAPPALVLSRLAWRTARLEFSNTPLGEVVATLNRHNAIKFVIADPQLERVPLSGVFDANDTDVFERMLEVGFGIVAERQTDNTVRLRKRVR